MKVSAGDCKIRVREVLNVPGFMCLGAGFLLDLSPNSHYFSARRQREALCIKWSRKFLSW